MGLYEHTMAAMSAEEHDEAKTQFADETVEK